MAKWLYPKSDHFDGKIFFNPAAVAAKSFWKFLKWQWQGQRQVWPKWVENEGQPQLRTPHKDHEVIATFINHAQAL